MQKKKNENSEEKNTECKRNWLDDNTLNEISSDDHREIMDDDDD
jgi:hypothetical protein